MWGEGKERRRGSKYNVCNFYRFIRVKSGIRGRKKEKKARREEGKARAILGKKRKKERKMGKPQSGRKKKPLIARQQVKVGGLRPEGGRFLHLDAL